MADQDSSIGSSQSPLPFTHSSLPAPTSTIQRRAVIDVGTNSVKLLLADVTGAGVEPVLERSEQTRLGRGFYDAHRLQPAAIESTARAVAQFAAEARVGSAARIRVIATSAARDATNAGELTQAIAHQAGLPTEIISGEQEAEWVFQGVASDASFGQQRLLLLDVGGGSTEFILGERGHHVFRQSFPLGSVRLLERLRPGNPPTTEDLARCRTWLKSFFEQSIADLLETFLTAPGHGEAQLVGTGGAATILARMEARMDGYDRATIERTRLSRARVNHHMDRLWSLGLAERQTIVGMPRDRADIVPLGVAIYETVMEHFGFPALRVSTRGLRFGAVLAS